MKQRMSSPSSTSQDAVNYKCQKCKDMQGFFVKQPQSYKDREYEVDVWIDCECMKQERIERLFKASAITEEFSKKTFRVFDHDSVHEVVKDAYDVAYEYVREFPVIREDRHNSIALLGRPGCGKTHLLMAVANNLLAKGVQVIYFPWVEGFNEIKNDFSALEARVRRLQEADVLFIDDMYKAADKPTAFEIKQSFAIVNYRYLNNLPILVSSERSFAEMCSYDEAIGSRLKEMCKGHTVTLKGGIELNYRLRED